MPTQALKTARRTAPREERQRQLIEATIDSIAEYGLSGTKTATLTANAGLSVGIVNLHFGSKDNLLLATLSFLAEEHRERWAGVYDNTELSPAERLWSIVEAHFHPSVCTPSRIAVWFAFFGEARYRKTYRSLIEAFDRERIDVLRELCQAIIDEGGYANVDALMLARAIESFADGLWLDLLMYPETIKRDDTVNQLRNLLALSFPQHFAPESPPRTTGSSP